jgi:Arc/MetJ family transcription regulator
VKASSLATPNDIVTHMKTTIDIADPLLARAKQVAAAEGVTLRELVEDGLRQVLEERERRPAFRLRRATFRGHGLQPDVAEGSWQRIRDLAYEGRGA